MWSSIVFAACLLAVSISMLARHRQVWRAIVVRTLKDHERRYLYGQYRRRTQASALIGVVGLAILAGVWITGLEVMLIYWSGVSLMVVWMGCLALADLFSTRRHFKQAQQEHLVERDALNAELERLRRRESNGRRASELREPNQDDQDI